MVSLIHTANLLIQIFTRPLDLMELGRSYGNRHTLLRIVITVGRGVSSTNKPATLRAGENGRANTIDSLYFYQINNNFEFRSKANIDVDAYRAESGSKTLKA